MIFLYIFAAVVGGLLLTYLSDDDASLFPRLCAGAIIGSVAQGLVCLVLASFFSFNAVTVWAAWFASALPLALLVRPFYRARVLQDFRSGAESIKQLATPQRAGRRRIINVVLFAALAVLFWFFFKRAVYETPEGMFTGVDNNFYDLTMHIGIVFGFVHGDNFPPIHPHFAGARLAYPFLIDFMAGMLMVAGGVTMSAAMFAQNMLFSLAMIGILHRWANKLTRDHLAATITLALILFYGGVGWVMLINESRETEGGILALLANLTHNYTVLWGEGWGDVLRFGNSLTTLFLPQRSFLLGVPIFVIVWTVWWQLFRRDAENLWGGEDATEVDGARELNRRALTRMIAAGLIAGLLPLAHAHSFLVLMGMGGCFALLTRRWRLWFAFFAAAGVLAVPQILWVTWGSETHAQRFAQWHLGWMTGEGNFLVFWFQNTGLFIPLLLVALGYGAWRRIVPRALLIFYAPFLLCFIVPNVMKLAPWEFDNIKVLFYWYVASAPLVALLLAHMFRSRNVFARGAAGALVISLTLAGCLDIWRVLSKSQELMEYDQAGLDLAELIKEATPPRSLILNAPVHNHAVLLAGRRSTLGYAQTVWTHGIDSEARLNDIFRIYEGVPEAHQMILDLGAEYVVVGPAERERIPNLNEEFFTRYELIGEAGGARLYQVTSDE